MYHRKRTAVGCTGNLVRVTVVAVAEVMGEDSQHRVGLLNKKCLKKCANRAFLVLSLRKGRKTARSPDELPHAR